MKKLGKIVSEHNAEESFLFGEKLYMIIQQSGGSYAVKANDLNNDDHDGIWLKHPESRYETIGGARYAILLDASDKRL